MGVSLDLQIMARQSRSEKAAGGRPAPSVLLVDMEVRNAFVAACVEVAHAGNAGFDSGLNEGIEDLPPHAGLLDAPFATSAVMLACAEIMVQVLAEDRFHAVPAPAIEPHLAPVVVILALSAHVDHGIDGRAAAQDLATGIVQD